MERLDALHAKASIPAHMGFLQETKKHAKTAGYSALHSLDGQKPTTEGNKRRGPDSQLPELDAKYKASVACFNTAKADLERANANRAIMYDIVASIFKDLLKGRRPDDCTLDEETFRKLREQIQPTKPFGAMFNVWYTRTMTGNKRSVLPDVLVRFAVGTCNTDRAALRRFTSGLPGIMPSEDKLNSVNQSYNAVSGPSAPCFQRVVDCAESENDRIGYFGVDEMGIKQVSRNEMIVLPSVRLMCIVRTLRVWI